MSKNRVFQKKTEEKCVLKRSLLQPYLISWPALEKGVLPFILSELQRLFSLHPEVKKVKSAGKKRKLAQVQSCNSENNFRQNFSIGIREVTKSLEKDELSLFLVCRSVKPQFFTNHLKLLGASRKIKAACVPDLSSQISEYLSLKSVLAIGFKRKTTSADVIKSVEVINQKLNPLSVPWDLGNLPTEDCSPLSKKLKSESAKDTVFLPTQICASKAVQKKPKKTKKQ